MATYIFVHGAWHGAWCWYKVLPLLRHMGHSAIAIDLPGHGIDKSDTKSITLDDYVDKVSQVIDAQPGPVILVGHSMGGGIITQVGEVRAERIEALIYVAALLPSNGQTFLQATGNNSPEDLPFGIDTATDTQLIDKSLCTQKFYNDCSEEDICLADMLLCAQPIGPIISPVSITDGNFGKLNKLYIACSKDNALDIELQKQFYGSIAFNKIVTLESGHSPFFSMAEDLTRIICKI